MILNHKAISSHDSFVYEKHLQHDTQQIMMKPFLCFIDANDWNEAWSRDGEQIILLVLHGFLAISQFLEQTRSNQAYEPKTRSQSLIFPSLYNWAIQMWANYFRVSQGRYWLAYIMGKMGKNVIQASSILWAIATIIKCAHRSEVIRLSLAAMLPPKFWHPPKKQRNKKWMHGIL